MEKEIENWWKQAEYDLKAAEDNLEIKQYYISAFLSQQAVEKALKALYLKEKKELIKTHKVSRLSYELSFPKELMSKISLLEPVYEKTRYPDISGDIPSEEFKEEDAVEFYNIAEEVLEWIRKKIGQ